MNRLIIFSLLSGSLVPLLLSGCSSEQPVHGVDDFLRDAVLLEATLVRCTQDRSVLRYEPDCLKAREAARLIEVREENARREQLEAESQRKRDALRRRQDAIAEARRKALEQPNIIETGGIIFEFEETPPVDRGLVSGATEVLQSGADDVTAEEPGKTSAPVAQVAGEADVVESRATNGGAGFMESPAARSDAGHIEDPAAENEAPVLETDSELKAVRRELDQRSDDDDN